MTSDGIIDGSLADRTDRIVEDGRTFSYVLYRGESIISVTQNDIRQIQLAKAALYAGVKLLMDRMGITSVDRIRLAGAFGSHIDVKLAMVLGMIPDCPLQQVASVGNAAGTGARIALLNNESREEIETVVRKIEKIETRGRNEVSGILRQRHGHPAQDGCVSQPGGSGDVAGG